MIVFLNKLPMPNLKHYCMLSFGLLAIVLAYFQKIFYEYKQHEASASVAAATAAAASENPAAAALLNVNLTDSIRTHGLFVTTYRTVCSEPWCIWVLINFCYCCLLLFSKVVQGITFGKLRAVENQVRTRNQSIYNLIIIILFLFCSCCCCCCCCFCQAYQRSLLELHLPQVHIHIRRAQLGEPERGAHVVQLVLHHRLPRHPLPNMQGPLRICKKNKQTNKHTHTSSTLGIINDMCNNTQNTNTSCPSRAPRRSALTSR